MKIVATIVALAITAGAQNSKPVAAKDIFTSDPIFRLQPMTDPTPQLGSINGSDVFVLKATHISDNQSDKAVLSFSQPGSGRIDRLSNEEYERLQKLRQAVADAETEIAKSHEVTVKTYCDGGLEQGGCLGKWVPGDSYEFHGQFLLVNVPAK